MGLGTRINRVIKSNVNSAIGNKGEGAAYIGGGAATGALTHGVVGNMGLALKGTAIGIYAPHLIVGGAVVGAAAYGIKKLTE